MMVIERSIKFMWKCKWRSWSVASSSCGNATDVITPPHPTPPHPRLPDVDLWDGNESVSINIHKPEVRFSSLHNWMTLESQLRVNPGAKAKRLCNEPIPQVSLTVRDQFWFAGIRTGAIWPLRGIWLWSAGGLNQEREVCKAWQCPLLMYFLHVFAIYHVFTTMRYESHLHWGVQCPTVLTCGSSMATSTAQEWWNWACDWLEVSLESKHGSFQPGHGQLQHPPWIFMIFHDISWYFNISWYLEDQYYQIGSEGVAPVLRILLDGRGRW